MLNRTIPVAFVGLCLNASCLLAFAHPGSGIVADASGDVYFSDTGHGIWKVTSDGAVSSPSQARGHFLAIDPQGAFAQKHFSHLERDDVTVAARGPGLLVGTSYPITVGTDGAFYYPQVRGKGRVKLMRMPPGEKAQLFAELPPAKEKSYTGEEVAAEWVWGMAAGPDGSIYYTEKHAVRKVAPDGKVSTAADNVKVPDCEHPPAVTESHVEPGLYGIAVADDGSVYVAAAACSALLKIAPDGTVSVALRATDGWSPQGVVVAGTTVYVLEYDYIKTDKREDWLPRVRKLAPDGNVTVIAEIDPEARHAAAKSSRQQ
ncbi:MAG: hypothetical protein HUU46_20030 [Candidatus Hydrogenedentes bacterium]|nr:hypothetical protein [Candidatus Hydrogenedentota bacterium]